MIAVERILGLTAEVKVKRWDTLAVIVKVLGDKAWAYIGVYVFRPERLHCAICKAPEQIDVVDYDTIASIYICIGTTAVR